ncbi:pantoate--beta-alanine ligase [Glutamicibacter protophormiae]|uniref:Pantothenate synthetase n=1 Tax=Kocuria varians TaxID=1272 RepID=A0A7D7Q413_KOCVA|nr:MULTISPECIES: pantoate--beta-alanine ligase [Kocuria]MDN5631879.1 pantoate--beta-alanine ligase [Kocuria sp.]QMS56462.1 Pantothenate synthetase [Kocuria varians]WNB87969.1 pantoate--beta-alanine ligase [Glutamicibacter protophormiae]
MTEPVVCTTVAQLREEVAARTAAGAESVGLLPTMGALHAGHLQIARRTRAENDVAVVSVFVNPLQFGPGEDFESYPRQLEQDVRLLAQERVDLVFAPSVEEMYPGGTPVVSVTSGAAGAVLEGATRPGHFDGALTVVNKLLTIVDPGPRIPFRAYFGEKDAQQLLLMQRMVRDFNHRVEIRPVPIVRSEQGLALSSRNQYLSPEQAGHALVLNATLRALAGGELTLDEARRRVAAEPEVSLDYLVTVDPDTLAVTEPRPGALALVAAWVGPTRLIDNMRIPA